MESREQFLLAMYAEAWRNIERHILVVWQVAAIVGSTLAVFIVVEKGVVPFGAGVAIEFVVLAWAFSHILDAEFWFRRNLHIITNIERQFLRPSDAAEIHPYFLPRAAHAKPPTLDHLLIQQHFVAAVMILLVAAHLFWTIDHGDMRLSWMPYGVLLLVLGWVKRFQLRQQAKHKDLEVRSPGRSI